MPTQIRQANLQDASALTRLLRELNYFHRLEGQTPTETLEQVRRQFAADLADDSHRLYVAEDENGELAGYIAVHWLPYLFLPGPEGYVSELFVRENQRGNGIGTRLFEVVHQEARQRGCSRLSLINMRQRESYQRGYYKSIGWEERPEAANFKYQLEE